MPTDAVDDLTGEYIPANDRRDAQILANCAATGVDPTMANLGGFFSSYSVEVQQGGSLELDPEESESWTVGFAFEQNFSNDI